MPVEGWVEISAVSGTSSLGLMMGGGSQDPVQCMQMVVGREGAMVDMQCLERVRLTPL